MRIDVETAQLIRILEQRGIPCLLLKGASVAKWLYENDERRFYFDIDLLISPDDVLAAERVLTELGYSTPQISLRGDRWIVRDWHRLDGLSVDLHRSLEGLGSSDERAWSILSETAVQMHVGGDLVPVLGPHARALHVALHALQHGRAHPQPLEDLRRAVDSLSRDIWTGALELARDLECEAPFAAGLALTASGGRLAESLDIPTEIDTEALLKQESAGPASLFIERVAKAGALGGARLVFRKAFPSPPFMRAFDPSARTSGWRLAVSYVKRWVWLAGQLRAGLSAWFRARRSQGAGGP